MKIETKRESRENRELSRNCNTAFEYRKNTIEPLWLEKVPVLAEEPGDLPK